MELVLKLFTTLIKRSLRLLVDGPGDVLIQALDQSGSGVSAATELQVVNPASATAFPGPGQP
jgi:hypothetical protein